MSHQETATALITESSCLPNGRDRNIIINSSEDIISGRNDHEVLAGSSHGDRVPRTIRQPSFSEQRSKSSNTTRTNSNDSESAIQEMDLPSEITFEKRSIPKTRTTSIQSVLSSVSLRSLAQQNMGYKNHPHSSMSNKPPSSSNVNKGSYVSSTNEVSQSQFINTKAHIQAPATAASSKLPSSFEIGQRLPFIKDANESNDNTEEQGESDGDGEDDGKLTVDALKNLGNFSRFIPAEVDLNITDEPDKLESAIKEDNPPNSLAQSHSTLHSAASNLSLNNFGSFNNMHNNHSTTHLQALRQPQPVAPYTQSPIIRKDPHLIQANETKSRLLSSTTSSQNLPPLRSSSTLRTVTSKASCNSPTISVGSSPSASVVSKTESLQQSFKQQQEQQQHYHQPTPHSVALSHSSSIDTASIKGISDLKRPMYVPAVLRQSPTNLNKDDVEKINAEKLERSKRLNHKSHTINTSSSLRPQQWKLPFNDQHSSLDSTLSKSTSPNATLPLIKSPLSNNMVRPSRSLMSLNLQQPTRAHWRRDTSRISCAYCSKPFTFFDRRHHCRKCGDIFCSEHTCHLVKLNQEAQFLTVDEFEGTLCKVCNNCFTDYERLVNVQYNVVGVSNNIVRSANGSRNGSAGNQSSNSGVCSKGTSTGVTSNLNISSKAHGNEDDKANEQVVGSVPVDWTWSSF